jgi:hypothetical protein
MGGQLHGSCRGRYRGLVGDVDHCSEITVGCRFS